MPSISNLVTVSNAMLLAIWDGVALPEAEKLRVVEASGLELGKIRDTTARTSIMKLGRYWNGMIEATGDDFLGLTVGMAVPGDRFGLAVHAAQNSETLGEVLRRFTKFASLINDLIRCELRSEGTEAHYSLRFFWDVLDLERHAVDIGFAALERWARLHLSGKPALKELRLKHGHVSAKRRYEELFQAPVFFGCPKAEMVFEASSLELQVTSGNPELGRILDRFAAQELARIPNLGDLPSRVTQFIQQHLDKGEAPELGGAAAELRMTPRNLQRRLAESSTSFSNLLDDVRKSLAPKYLGEPGANVEQVAYRLGYTEPGPFIRAFKKWFGITPGAFRAGK